MKFIIAIVFCCCSIFISCSNDQKPANVKVEKIDTLKPDHNVYAGLRDMALNMTRKDLQLPTSGNDAKVYGVVMDWDLGHGIATLVSFETGDASMYLSSGGGMLGGRGHQEISDAAKKFVAYAQEYVSKAKLVTSTPLVNDKRVIFYLLTPKGKFSVQDAYDNMNNGSSPLIPLFTEANKVLAELRKVEEAR